MAGWTSPLNLIREELVQLRDEGCASRHTCCNRLPNFIRNATTGTRRRSNRSTGN